MVSKEPIGVTVAYIRAGVIESLRYVCVGHPRKHGRKRERNG